MRSLKVRIFAALDNAVSNGYHKMAKRTPPDEVAVDLTTYDAELEDESVADVAPLVQEWRRKLSS